MPNDPPAPRDYPDYDEYRAALEEWEWQQDQLDDPDGSKAREAEKRMGILARFKSQGRAPRCMPSCRKPLCLEREACVWVELQIIQDMSATWYFQDNFPSEFRLVDPEAMQERTKRGLCSVLPACWQKDGAYEHRVLCFLMQVWDQISLGMSDVEGVEQFGNDVYRFVLQELRGIPWEDREAGIGRMSAFLRAEQADMPLMSRMLLQSAFTSLAREEEEL